MHQKPARRPTCSGCGTTHSEYYYCAYICGCQYQFCVSCRSQFGSCPQHPLSRIMQQERRRWPRCSGCGTTQSRLYFCTYYCRCQYQFCDSCRSQHGSCPQHPLSWMKWKHRLIIDKIFNTLVKTLLRAMQVFVLHNMYFCWLDSFKIVLKILKFWNKCVWCILGQLLNYLV